MDKNEELQKKAQPGELAIKGTRQPDVTTEPVAPVAPVIGDANKRWREDGLKDPAAGDKPDED